MRGFVQWLDEEGFWIKDTYDHETGNWISGGGWLILEPHQRHILGHCLTPNDLGRFPYTTIIYSTTKKSGKSAIAAAVAAWAAEEFPAGSEIFIAANSREQAEGRVTRDLKYHVEHSRREYFIPEVLRTTPGVDRGPATVNLYKVIYPNQTFVQALARNHSANAGSRHALTVWDELWGYDTENELKMWDELTPIPTVQVSLRFVATYAGYEDASELLWSLYTLGVSKEEHEDGQGEWIPEFKEADLPCYRNGRLFVYWEHENRMPWQTEEYLDEQFKNERPSAYLRFHENRWVTSKETFIPVEWFDMAVENARRNGVLRSTDYWLDHPYYHWPVHIAIDASTRRDSTALVGVTYDASRGVVVELFHKIWKPEKAEEGELFDLWETAGQEALLRWQRHVGEKLVYDPTQMHQIAVQLAQNGVEVQEYKQNSTMMTAVSQTLYDLLQRQSIWCIGGEEARAQITYAIALETPTGFRIVKDKGRKKHKIDYVVALAMACHSAIGGGGQGIPNIITWQSAFEDQTHWKPQDEMLRLPAPFRE